MRKRFFFTAFVFFLCTGYLAGCDCGSGEWTGGNDQPGPDDPDCIPVTCEDLGKNCGNISDGCGKTIFCGQCPEGQICGGSGIEGVCGIPIPDCTPKECPSPNHCGPMPDGCGDFVNCGPCEPPLVCGGEEPSICGQGDSSLIPECTPVDCEQQGVECGPAADGCGGIIDCGSCPDPDELCGGAGPSLCGVPECTTRLTCADVGAECGRVGDGCGGLIDCGTCPPGQTCGGGDELYRCGSNPDAPQCTGPWCGHQVGCPVGQSTSLRGKVYAPNGQIPIANAEVFVPNEIPVPINDGIACLRCEDRDLDDFLVVAVTASDGSFVLNNIPADVKFPLVVQVGKWRRVVEILAVPACTTVDLTPEQTRLPRNSDEGHIPRIAISTGAVDGLECVLYKAGVDQSEFTPPGGNGRIHIYRGNGAWPSQDLYNQCGGGNDTFDDEILGNLCIADTPQRCPSDTCRNALAHNLYSSQANLNQYDVVILACEAMKYPFYCWWTIPNQQGACDGSSYKYRTPEARGYIRNYVNHGGRLFLSHWSFDWLWNDDPPTEPCHPDFTCGGPGLPYENHPLSTTCNWEDGSFNAGGVDVNISQAFVDSSFERGLVFSEWLDHVGASTSTGVLTIREPRGHCRHEVAPGRRWVYTTNQHHGGDSVQQLTFNTPVGASDDEMCGRVAYSAFHVTTGVTHNHYFPQHCGGAMTAQEKVLLYMLFDLAACLSDEDNPQEQWCNPLTCAELGAECGLIGDGCGGEVDCGDCPPGQSCGGGGIPHKCGSMCDPITSCDPHECGRIPDGCGGDLDCGPCPEGYACRGGPGIPNVCIGGGCTPLSCSDWEADCGRVPDGCGSILICGDCPPGEHCVTVDGRLVCIPIG